MEYRIVKKGGDSPRAGLRSAWGSFLRGVKIILKDTYILSYLCGYQIKSVENSYNICGFPKVGLNKTLKILEDNNINYLVTIKSLNYEVEEEMKHKDKNNYTEIYEKAYRYVTVKK